MSKMKVAKNVEIDLDEMTDFILYARQSGWQGDTPRADNPQRPGFKEFPPCRDGPWEYVDSYAGSLLAPGQEIVRFNELPVWNMSYNGGMLPAFHNNRSLVNATYDYLKRCLMKADRESPFRGKDAYVGSAPKEFPGTFFLYEIQSEGDISRFKGTETITWGHDSDRKGQVVFNQDFIGGVIVHKLV